MPAADDAWCRLKKRAALKDGSTVAYVDTGGQGPVHLLLHGYSDTSRSFELILPFLLQAETARHRLIIPDLPGHGDSPMREIASIAALTDHIAAFCAAIAVQPAAVTGHSLGSLLALSLAARPGWQSTRTTTLAGTACPSAGGLADLQPIHRFTAPLSPEDPFFEAWYHGPKPIPPTFLRSVRDEAARMPVTVWQTYLALIEQADIRPLLQTIQGPLLAISGTEDHLFDGTHGQVIARSVPQARGLRLPGIGHNPHWDDPAGLGEMLAETSLIRHCAS